MNLKQDYTYKADGWENPDFDPKPSGIMVHSTATPGVMAQAFRDRWDRPNVGASVHAFVDDTVIVQCLPWTKRAGHAGGTANRTHLSFEMCEPGGFYYAGGANMVGYNVKEQEPYFRKVWQNAVELCAYLCKEFDLDPMRDIICHSEGYEMGIASGHADVMHWFPKHGENMDTFRAAVKKEMEPEEDDGMLSYAQFKEYMEKYEAEQDGKAEPAWSVKEGSWGKAVNEGIIHSGAPEGYIKRDEVIAVLGRLGLLDVHQTVTGLSGTGDAHSSWADTAVGALTAAGIFGGDGSGNYGWGQCITREAVAKVLYELMERRGDI